MRDYGITDFGLTLDVNQAVILGWGGITTPDESAEIEYMVNTNLGVVGRGDAGRGYDYSIGGEVGGSYDYAHAYERGNHIFGWNAGVRADFFRTTGGYYYVRDSYTRHASDLFWGVGAAAGYKGEHYSDKSIEHGFYVSLVFKINLPGVGRIPSGSPFGVPGEIRPDNDFPGASLSMGFGPYVAYFPHSGRGEAGFGFLIAADPFLI